MRALDPRLLRQARAARTFLVASVGLGVGAAVLVVVQAFLLAYAVSAVFHGGDGRRDLGPVWVALAAVVLGRAAVVWAQEATAHRCAAAVRTQLRERLLAHGSGSDRPGCRQRRRRPWPPAGWTRSTATSGGTCRSCCSPRWCRPRCSSRSSRPTCWPA